MNPVIQISDGKTGGSSTKGRGQAANASGGNREFDGLLGVLASAVDGGATAARHSKTGTSEKKTGETAVQKGSGSAAQKGAVSLTNTEEMLLEAMKSGKQKAKPRGSSSASPESVSRLVSAGVPFVARYQSAEKSTTQAGSSSGSGHTTGEAASSILARAERDITSLLKADNADSGSEGKLRSADSQDSGQTKAASGKSAGTSKSGAEADMLKLMTSASSGRIDEKTLRELNGLLAKVDAGKSSSAKALAQKIEGDTGDSSMQPAGGSSVRSASRPAIAVKDNLSGVITSVSQSSGGNNAVGEVHVKPAGAAAENVGQNGNTGDHQAISGTNASNSPEQAVPKQGIQAQLGRFDQNGQNFGDAGKNQTDASNFGATRVYTSAVNNTALNVSFTQTLSATSQSFSNTAMTPNLQQLTQGIVKQASMMTLEGKKIVNVKLQPESLGSLTLQVVSDGGKISAQFNVRTTDARAFLESSAPQMKQMLESNGVTLAHLSVNLSGGEFQSGNPRQGYKPRRQQAKYFNDTTDTVAPVASTETSRSFGYNTMEMQV